MWSLQGVIDGVAEDDGLTLKELLSDIPHDVEAVVLYLILGFSAWLVWWGNRNSGRKGRVLRSEPGREIPASAEAPGEEATPVEAGSLAPEMKRGGSRRDAHDGASRAST